MKHLFNYSVCQSLQDLPGNGSDIASIGCDGLEMFTLFEKVPEEYISISPSVHLPFAIDWYRGWQGKADLSEFDESNVKHVMYGRDREEMAKNISEAIAFAAEIEPAYGVFHASNTNVEEVMFREQTDDSKDVLSAFCELMNMTVSRFKGGEPPLKLAFENLWWPGLKLLDPWEYDFMTDNLEFDNWGFCLDTGHMMNTLTDAYEEDHCIDRLLGIFQNYPKEMKDRICTMHLHFSTSSEYRSTFEPSARPKGETMQETISRSYEHVMKIDQHRPFTSSRCKLLVDELQPDFVTHEIVGDSVKALEGFKLQRSHFPM